MRLTRLVLPALLLAVPAIAAAEEPAAGAMQLTDKQTFLLPIDEPGNRLPTYPEAVLAQQPIEGPRYVCMRVDLDAEGKVTWTGPIVREPECPAITVLTKQFADASVAALSAWRFEPATICTFRTKTAKEAAGMSCQGGKEEPTPTSLTFRLMFEQSGGQGVVRMQRG